MKMVCVTRWQPIVVLFAFVVLSTLFVVGCRASPEPKGDDKDHGNLGASYANKGQYELAEKETRIAIAINPNSSVWRQNLGFILTATGREDEAIDELKKSLEIDKDWGKAYRTGSFMEIGTCLYGKKNYTESISYLEKTIASAAAEHLDNATLSKIYVYLSYNYTDGTKEKNPHYDLKKAEQLKRKALELGPSDLFTKASIVKLLILQDDIKSANSLLDEVTRSVDKGGGTGGVYSYLGHIYSMLKNPKRSAAYMEKALEVDPRQAHYLLRELDGDFKDVANTPDMQRIVGKARKLSKGSN